MSSIAYTKVSTVDNDDPNIQDGNDNDNDIEFGLYDHNNPKSHIMSIQSQAPVVITRIPLTGRDIVYSMIFLCHFGLILSLSNYHELSEKDSFIPGKSEGLWTSMVMTVTILGLFSGGLVLFLLVNVESRDYFLSMSIPFSILVQICMGNVLIHFKTSLSPIGLLFLISAVLDLGRYRSVTRDISFNCAMLGFVLDIMTKYGFPLITACIGIASVQTCILLLWGVYLVDFVGDVPREYLEYIVILMLFSLYWIKQFFHAMISYVVGGCFVWYFIRNENEPFQPSKRVLLHIQGSLSCGLGSLCKGALWAPPSALLLLAASRLGHDSPSQTTIVSGSSCCLRCCHPSTAYGSLLNSVCHSCVMVAHARHRIAFPLAATYGLTLHQSLYQFNATHPTCIDLITKDSGRHALNSLPILVGGLVALVFGILTARNEPQQTQVLFILLIYLFCYCGVSIVVAVLQVAIDALYVVFYLNPEKFAAENQIIFLRLLRASETSLQ